MSEQQSTLFDSVEQPEVQYRDVPGFPGYRVGDDGSVWSCRSGSRWVKNRFGAWRQLVPTPGIAGRLRVSLCTSDGRKISHYVHRLVLEAFVGPCPEGMQACHFPDRDSKNNNLSNLRWDTAKENHQDKHKHGTTARGERQGAAKLTREDVISIRENVSGLRIYQLARKFGVSRRAIYFVLNREHWGWLTDTNEELSSRRMTDAERQMELPLDD